MSTSYVTRMVPAFSTGAIIINNEEDVEEESTGAISVACAVQAIIQLEGIQNRTAMFLLGKYDRKLNLT